MVNMKSITILLIIFLNCSFLTSSKNDIFKYYANVKIEEDCCQNKKHQYQSCFCHHHNGIDLFSNGNIFHSQLTLTNVYYKKFQKYICIVKINSHSIITNVFFKNRFINKANLQLQFINKYKLFESWLT